MAQTTLSSREFNQDVGRAKRSADTGPVIITDRGKPTYVLMRHEDYERLSAPRRSIVEILAQTGPEADFEFDPPKAGPFHFKIPDFDD